jgi:hypothetical protein
MLKKLFVTAAAAAAVSVPLAGVAWAGPSSDTGSNGNGVGQGGIPTKVGNFATNNVVPNANPNPGGVGPMTPGSTFSQLAKVPDVSTPVAYGDALTGLFATHTVTGVPGGFPRPSRLAPPLPGWAPRFTHLGALTGRLR